MDITVTKTELLQGVNMVNKAVASRTTMPILECILIKAKDEIISFTGNDTELGIETTIDGEINDEGIMAIEAKTLTELTKKLPDEFVYITTDNAVAHFKCGKLKADVPIKNGEDFPKIPSVSKDNEITISQFALKEIIRQTIFSIADNNSNKMMTGELFEISDSQLKVTALDGHRIAMRKIELNGNYESKKVIVPGKALNEIARILPGNIERNVNIYLTDNYALFEFDYTTVITRLIDGDFFDTERIIGINYSTEVKINRQEFFESIDRSTLFISNLDKKPVVIEITEDKLEWSVKTASGSMTESIDIDKEGKDIKIGFDPRLLIDAIKAIDEDEITLGLTASNSPLVIKNDGYLYLVLPINLGGN